MDERVLLIRPNHTQDKKDTYVTFPLGLAYIGAVLLKNGCKVQIIDLILEDVNYDSLTDRIRKFNPTIIGISALSYEYIQVKRLSAYLKTVVSCKIILGGHLANHSYDMILKKTSVDVCILGEGESTVVDVISNLSALEKVKGIAYRDDGKVILNSPRELINDLDTIPFPAYELFDIDKYSKFLMDDMYISHKYLPKKKVHRQMTLEASRGCPFACNFCSKVYTRVRRRNLEKIVEEIKYLNETYDIDVFGFHDELVFSNKAFATEFCRAIKPLGVSWYGMLRVDIVNREILKMFTESGCLTISFGVESGSERILKNMNKKVTPAQIEKTLRDAFEVGLSVDMSLILGYPGEDEESVHDTIDLLKRVGYPGIKFRYVTPYPGSSLYNQCIENGLIKDEEAYLESLGDGTGPYRFRINFTKFTDEELTALLPRTTKKILRNYLLYLLKHPGYLCRYLTHKDVMNPVYYYYNRWFRPTNYDKAAKRKAN